MITIKNASQIAKMREAGALLHEVLEQLKGKIEPGITTKELDCYAEKLIRGYGAVPSFLNYEGYPASICASVDSQVVHGIPDESTMLREGQIISIDSGLILDGWQSDSAFTVGVGTVSPQAQRLIDVTEQSFFAALQVAREGYRVSDIGHAVQQYVEERGFSAVRDLCGHGIGREMHEDPSVPNFGAPGPAVQVQALCDAMAAVDGVFWLITGSNADAGGQVCTAMMQTFAAAHPDRAGFVQSLGLRRYLSAMDCAALVAGNSSSGVVETPTFKVPTVNIGRRQAGRAICANVLCCDADESAIEAALRRALSPAFAPVAAGAVSPYNGGETSEKICAVLAEFDFARPKIFYDGPVPEFDPQRSVLV